MTCLLNVWTKIPAPLRRKLKLRAVTGDLPGFEALLFAEANSDVLRLRYLLYALLSRGHMHWTGMAVSLWTLLYGPYARWGEMVWGARATSVFAKTQNASHKRQLTNQSWA